MTNGGLGYEGAFGMIRSGDIFWPPHFPGRMEESMGMGMQGQQPVTANGPGPGPGPGANGQNQTPVQPVQPQP